MIQRFNTAHRSLYGMFPLHIDRIEHELDRGTAFFCNLADIPEGLALRGSHNSDAFRMPRDRFLVRGIEEAFLLEFRAEFQLLQFREPFADVFDRPDNQAGSPALLIVLKRTKDCDLLAVLEAEFQRASGS